jgi:hypothetical protein
VKAARGDGLTFIMPYKQVEDCRFIIVGNSRLSMMHKMHTSRKSEPQLLAKDASETD